MTSNRHTSYFESLEGMFFNSENNSAIITSGINFPPSTENVSATYSPALFIGPSDILCEGQEWFSASVTQTTSSISDLTGNGPAVSQTLPTNFGIDSIGDIVTVPGGTYSTIKMTVSYPSSRTIIWTDLDFGVRVMSVSYQGNSENPSTIEKLTKFDLPF